MTSSADRLAVFAPRFDAAGIEWMIAGGVASIVYGEPRLTQDLDVVAAISPRGAERFARQLPEPEFYCALRHVIETIAAMRHPHVLPLFDSGEADGFLYYVMPLQDMRLTRSIGTPVPSKSSDESAVQWVRTRPDCRYASRCQLTSGAATVNCRVYRRPCGGRAHGLVHHDAGRPLGSDWRAVGELPRPRRHP